MVINATEMLIAGAIIISVIAVGWLIIERGKR